VTGPADGGWEPRSGGWGGRRRGGPPWARGDAPPWVRHRGPRPWFAFFGCLFLALVLVVAVVAALATWLAGVLLGLVSPGVASPAVAAVAVLVVLGLAILLFGRVFGQAWRPLADLAAASERLADGEPGVRVRVRGPGQVRGLAASFNAMAERLDRSREDRRALLADVTHELRTPLTVISGGLEAMLDGVHPLDEDHVAPLLAQAEVMDRLLDDLRTLSLAEAGALPLYREPTDLRALAEEVAAAHAAAATSAGVELSATGDASLETSVDPVRVGEILANLVANALRHTPRGGRVTIEVRAAGGEAVLAVADTGEGIPPAELERIFDRFHRRADSGGSGLGLAIVRDLATAHGGRVEAESDGVPGHGTTLRVRLPIRG
jgi:signal transduction histidine kinase